MCTGLPIYLLSQGFSGAESAFTLNFFLKGLTPPTRAEPLIYWAIATTLVLLPLLAIPFALRGRSKAS
jgi:hypothetical protein